MIIGFCGGKETGKDTGAAYLIKEYNFERRAFADPLKKAVSELFDIHFSKVDNFKYDNTVKVALGYKTDPPQALDLVQPDHMWSPIVELGFREFLQRFGTEMARNVFGSDFWIDLTLPVEGFYAGRKIVISDVRFQNEIDRINSLGGAVVRLHRPEVEGSQVDLHASEQVALLTGIAYEIGNDSSLDDYYAEVDIMLDWFTEASPNVGI